LSEPTTIDLDCTILEEIPSLPSLTCQIIESCANGHHGYQETAELISHDPILTARILTLVNSPSLALPTKIRDLGHAISLLGRAQVRNLALSISLFDTFSPGGRQREIEMIAFWRHCIACAQACQEIAQELDYPEPEEAFLAGLLHDIGKLILYHLDHKGFSALLEELRDLPAHQASGWNPLEIEERRLGLAHHLVGKRATEKWNFPPAISEAVWLHHQPPTTPRSQPPTLPLLVRFADAFCNLHNLGANYFINHELGYSTATPHTHTVESLRNYLRLDDEFLPELYRRTDLKLHEFDTCLETVDNELYFATIHKAHRELGRLNLERQRELAELGCKNRLLEALAALNRQTNPQIGLPELMREIVAQARFICDSRFAFCGLSLDEDDPCCWFGQWGEENLSAESLATDSSLNGEREAAPKRSQRNRVLTTLKRLVTRKPEMLLKNSRITPLKDHPNILVIPLTGVTGPGFKTTIYGQLLVDCRKLARQLLKKPLIIETISRFATGVGELLQRYWLLTRLNGQAEHISELCRHSEELQYELLQAQRLATVGRLAAGAAHEINNPLTVISGQLQILKNQATQEANQNEREIKNLQRYEKMMRKVDKISRIVNDLLTYGRPQKPRRQPVVLQEAITQALESVKHRPGFSHIECQLEIPASLPPVLADLQQLGQILINLLINAELAMPDGGHITIAAATQTTEETVTLTLSDTGHGIPPEILPSIFDPFFTTREGEQGTGLGLSIVHSLVEANHGRITVSSIPNRGTSFTLQLPAAPTPEQAL